MNYRLKDILNEINTLEVRGNTDFDVRNVTFDSRKVKQGDLFVAVKGTQVDGHNFIEKAVEAGASAVIGEKLPASVNAEITWVKTKDSSRALALAASAFYGYPSRHLNLTGITGTNGKTTIVTLLYKLFREFGDKAGLLSTVRNYINGEQIDATHTTPDAMGINNLLRKMVDAGCQYAFMEVSSHAIHQNRIAGLDFDLAIFSNITHDHLDYHHTFLDYLNAKKKFFDELPDSACALANIDDKNGAVMLQNTKAGKYTYALKKPADFKAKVLENSFSGLQMEINGKQVWTRLVGDFNAYNLLAVYAAAVLLERNKDNILLHLSALKPAEGRFEVIQSQNKISAIVDYAHTPDALENVVKTIGSVRANDQQFIIVVGAGGDRDKTKRPQMAKIAAQYADKIILTSDNPRSEDPQQIINEMKKGISAKMSGSYLEITDRKQAIRTAFMLAKDNDIVLVAGKGHETYQEVNGVKHHFDDKEIIQSIFNQQ